MAFTRRAGTLTVNNIDASNNTTATIPASAVAGDVAVISVDGPSGTAVSATGWTYLGYSGTSLSVLWKILSASDPGSTVTLNGVGKTGFTTHAPVSVEVWTGPAVNSATFAQTSGVWPSATAPVGSVPLYIGYGYNNGSIAPSSVTPPAGIAGSYITYNSGPSGFGAWYGPASTVASVPSVTFGFTSSTATLATVVLSAQPSIIIAGAQSAQDQTVQAFLAGANAGADTLLAWTP